MRVNRRMPTMCFRRVSLMTSISCCTKGCTNPTEDDITYPEDRTAVDYTKLHKFKDFYGVITKTKGLNGLESTPLGHAGSERILNNDLLHNSPWQASCVELRERPAADEPLVLAYGHIDFASLRKNASSALSGNDNNYAHLEPNNTEPSRLEVVHYHETSTPEGLAGYQYVATQVMQGLLPGTCTNYTSEGGFAVWVVPHDVYLQLLANRNNSNGIE